MNVFIKIVLCWIICFHYCKGFNIECLESTLRYVRSPALNAQMKKTESDTESRTRSEEKIPTLTPSYFGNELAVGSDLSLIIGAPKLVDPANPTIGLNPNRPLARGDISSCPRRNIFSSSQQATSCASITPPGSQLGDSYGLSVGTSPNGNLLACSPTKAQMCLGGNYNPGYCYKSNDKGMNWVADPKTRSTECPPISLDMIFLLDGSNSVGHADFEVVKNWTKLVARNFDLRDGSTQLGVIQFSHYYEEKPLSEQPYLVTEIGLGQYNDQQNFDKAVDGISLFGYSTYTAKALNKSVLEFQTSPRFNQESTTKVLILLTDGRSSDHPLLASTAEYVRSLSITTFAVGVGSALDSELRTVATGTESDERVYHASNFNGLNDIINELRTAIINFALEGTQTGSSTTTYDLQVAEMGFSTHHSANIVYILIFFFVYKIAC